MTGATLRQVPHPITGAIYRELGNGTVAIEDRARGLTGTFSLDGRWISGNLTHADLALLRYVAGPDLPPGKDIYWGMTPPHEDAEAAAPAPPHNRPASEPVIARYTGDRGIATDDGPRASSFVALDYLLDHDRRPEAVPEVYRLQSPMPGGPQKVSTDRFHRQEYHDREVDAIWRRCWQMACREDDIPNVGDYVRYDIAHLSFLVVRTGEREFMAHQNACLHRGRTLREHDGCRAREFRCPYHGWSWSIEGRIKEITCEWDFPGVREDVAQLPGARVATWGGFVFINPDPDAEPLEDYLGPVMLAHFAGFRLENRYKQAHVSRVMPANWKVAMEAFMEGYHVIATHPQMLLAGGDSSDARYDVFGNFGRAGHVGSGISSPQRGIVRSREEMLAAWHAGADANRAYLRGLIGDEVERYSDAELNDVTFNDVFPNFHPWGGWGRMVFRFRPHGSDPERSIMDIMMLAPWPEGKPKPPPAQLQVLADNESWTSAPALGAFAKVLDQDVANMVRVQVGLKMKQPPYVWYSAYQEGKIRNFYRNYDRRMDLGDPAADCG